MVEEVFKPEDAHKNLKNLTPEQAQHWVKVANIDYNRRRGLGGAPNICKTMAARSTNTEFLGDRPYERP